MLVTQPAFTQEFTQDYVTEKNQKNPPHLLETQEQLLALCTEGSVAGSPGYRDGKVSMLGEF